jgi:hypothetical protein
MGAERASQGLNYLNIGGGAVDFVLGVKISSSRTEPVGERATPTTTTTTSTTEEKIKENKGIEQTLENSREFREVWFVWRLQRVA